MRDLKTQIVLALSAWVSQRPGLEYGNYGDVSSYRAEVRSIGKDLQHARALINYLAHEGVLDMPADPLPAPVCGPTPLEGVEPIAAPHAGVLVFLRELGEKVAAGDAIADIIDPVSGATTTLRTKVAGVFFARTAHRHLLRGMQVGKIAGPVAFRAGKLLSQ